MSEWAFFAVSWPLWIGTADKVPFGFATWALGLGTGWLLCKALNRADRSITK